MKKHEVYIAFTCVALWPFANLAVGVVYVRRQSGVEDEAVDIPVWGTSLFSK
jgi:hypothetical protein